MSDDLSNGAPATASAEAIANYEVAIRRALEAIVSNILWSIAGAVMDHTSLCHDYDNDAEFRHHINSIAGHMMLAERTAPPLPRDLRAKPDKPHVRRRRRRRRPPIPRTPNAPRIGIFDALEHQLARNAIGETGGKR